MAAEKIYQYMLGAAEFMVSARYNWGRRKERTEEEIKADIEALKQSSSEHVDMAMLDRRAYCLTNSIVATEGELPIYEKQIASLESMPEEVKNTPYWVLNHTLLKHRLDESKTQIEVEKKELADITEKLKVYDFEKGRKKFDEELEELKLEEEEDAKAIAADAGPGEGSNGTPSP